MLSYWLQIRIYHDKDLALSDAKHSAKCYIFILVSN